MMLIDSNHRALDFQYILWRFDTKDLDTATLGKLDAGPGQTEGDMDEDENLSLLLSMGFPDIEEAQRALRAAKNDLNEAVRD